MLADLGTSFVRAGRNIGHAIASLSRKALPIDAFTPPAVRQETAATLARGQKGESDEGPDEDSGGSVDRSDPRVVVEPGARPDPALGRSLATCTIAGAQAPHPRPVEAAARGQVWTSPDRCTNAFRVLRPATCVLLLVATASCGSDSDEAGSGSPLTTPNGCQLLWDKACVECEQHSCGAAITACFGADWARGEIAAGSCKEFGSCAQACSGCDEGCVARCLSKLDEPGCKACIETVAQCERSADCKCGHSDFRRGTGGIPLSGGTLAAPGCSGMPEPPFSGASPPGSDCDQATSCAPVCCACASPEGSSWVAAACFGGVCAPQATTCASTENDAFLCMP